MTWIRFRVLPSAVAGISAIKGLNEELAAARDDPLPVQGQQPGGTRV